MELDQITLERDELKDENLALESDIGMLQNELNQRLRCASDDTQLTLAQPTSIPDSRQHHHPAFEADHGDSRSASLVQRPQARYPSRSDSWPAKLLSSLPGALQGHERKQNPQPCCSTSSSLTSSSSGAQMDDNGKLG